MCQSDTLKMDSLKASSVGMTNSSQSFKISANSKIISQRVKSWINKTYENPSKVVSGWDVDGGISDKMIITGFQPNIFYYQNFEVKYYVDVKYSIDIIIEDSTLSFKFEIISMTSTSKPPYLVGFVGPTGLFNKNGESRPYWMKTNAIKDLESFVNSLLFSLHDGIISTTYSSDEALSELKRIKDKFDLGLITEKEFNEKRNELSKFIN